MSPPLWVSVVIGIGDRAHGGAGGEERVTLFGSLVDGSEAVEGVGSRSHRGPGCQSMP